MSKMFNGTIRIGGVVLADSQDEACIILLKDALAELEGNVPSAFVLHKLITINMPEATHAEIEPLVVHPEKFQ